MTSYAYTLYQYFICDFLPASSKITTIKLKINDNRSSKLSLYIYSSLFGETFPNDAMMQ